MRDHPPEVLKKGTVLVVDDDDFFRTVMADRLRQAGFTVEEAGSVEVALEALASADAEAVLSDILMPGVSGLDMLRMIRSRDLDIPVVLITGSPSLDTAIQAVEGGAFRYLRKSADLAGVVETMEEAVRLCQLARWRRQALVITQEDSQFVGDRASLEMSFQEALEGLWLAAQPIVRARDGALFGVELLSRTFSGRFTSISGILNAAERLGLVPSLGRRVRKLASNLDIAQEVAIFINLHSLDFDDEELYAENNPLCLLGSQVVLEVTERQPIDQVKDLKEKVARLRRLGFRIAVDDMGSGYSGLNSFAALRPDIAKVDLAIVRGIDSDPYRQKLIRSLVSMCGDFGIPLVAEGVETQDERECLVDLGCDYLQGFLCGVPEAPRVRSPSLVPPSAAPLSA